MTTAAPAHRNRFRNLARLVLTLLLVAGAIALDPESGAAQQAAAAPAASPTVVVSSRNWFLDSVVVITMLGLALFAVCRSSRRN